MILSGYNKFIFSIFSEGKDYLILTIFVLRVGKGYLSFLQIQYTRADASGKIMPSYVYNTRLKVIDNSGRDIIFSKGKIIFKDDAVKVEFATNIVMIYLNYAWNREGTSPLEVLNKENTEDKVLAWNSYDFKSFVKGNFVTPNTRAEFNNAAGNIDLVKSKKIPKGVNGILWSRLHHKDIDLTYSFIFCRNKKSISKMFLLHENNLNEFSEIVYQSSKEKFSSRSSGKYPENFQIFAKNETCQVSVNTHNVSETFINELVNDLDFTGKLFSGFLRRYTGNPKGLRLLSIADVTIINEQRRTELNGLISFSDYVSFRK